MRIFNFFSKFTPLCAALLLTGCSNQATSNAQNEQRLITPISMEVSVGQTLAGNYLAGRYAQRQQDWQAADKYMNAVLTKDRDNRSLLQRSFLLSLGAGNFDTAKTLADRIIAEDGFADLALIYLACEALNNKNYREAADLAQQLPDTGFGQYTRPLLSAWSLAGMGQTEEAAILLKDSTEEDDPTWHIHAGMMHELGGLNNTAAKHYKIAMETGLTLNAALVVANFFAKQGQPDIATSIYENLDAVYPKGLLNLPTIEEARNAPALTPADGAALALFELASLLQEKHAYDSALIYSRLVERLNGHSGFAKMLIGDVHSINNRPMDAATAYDRIDKQSPVYWISQLRKAETLENSGYTGNAIQLLTDLSKDHDIRTRALTSLGDIYRRHEQFEKAIEAYTVALEKEDKIDAQHWPIVYARGMALERVNDWPRAEKDLLKALEFQPENPMILNFIGYSWADQGIHLDKALDMLRRAVALRPNDGFILDSYGWALYRKGEYKESIVWLEKAVERVPGDATILNHLGDAYWQVNRQLEAKFQWERALNLATEPPMREQLRHKIMRGLPPATMAKSDTGL